MKSEYSRIASFTGYTTLILILSIASAAFILVRQEAAMNANKERIGLFHVPSILHTSNMGKQLLRVQQYWLQEISELNTGEDISEHHHTTEGPTTIFAILDDLSELRRLQDEFGEIQYENILDKVNARFENLGDTSNLFYQRDIATISNEILAENLETNIADTRLLMSAVNQLERLHIAEYERLNDTVEVQSQRRNSIGVPAALAILFGAFAALLYLTGRTRHALQRLENSDQSLHELNSHLEIRIVERTESLNRSRETYKTLFDNAPIAYFNIDTKGRIRRWNLAAAHLLGLSTDQLQSWTAASLEDSLATNEAKQLFREMALGTVTRNEELSYQRPDGETIHGLVSVTPILDDNGDILDILCMVVDISELREAQEAIVAMQKELLVNERLAAIGQLTATVSHEIRNPLGAIRSASDALKRLLPADNKQATRALALLDRSQLRCNRIIEELLDYTRVRALELTKAVPGQWLDELLDDCSIPSNVQVHKEYSDDIQIEFDQNRIEQAVRNIIDNACHAIQSGVEPDEAEISGHLTISTRVREPQFELSFVDTGCGITSADKENIFEPLFTTKSFGVGLGLPIVKQIMEQHNGDVMIDSEQDVGTTVTLRLPLTREQ